MSNTDYYTTSTTHDSTDSHCGHKHRSAYRAGQCLRATVVDLNAAGGYFRGTVVHVIAGEIVELDDIEEDTVAQLRVGYIH